MNRIEYPIHVFFDDTDMSGAVYHGKYVVWLEHARHQLITASGMTPAQIMEKHGIGLVVSRLAIKYVRPARFEDRLVATAAIIGIDRHRLHFEQTIERGGKLLIRAEVISTCIDVASGRPAEIPTTFINRLPAAPQKVSVA